MENNNTSKGKENGHEHGNEGQHGHGGEHPPKLFIFVNRLKFDESKGVKAIMTPDEIARLVGQTAETAIVREIHGQSDQGTEVTGPIEIKQAAQFTVTRRTVVGGYASSARIEAEIASLREGGQEVEYLPGPPQAVIYRALEVRNQPGLKQTDVLLMIPPGYPAAMLDHAWLPAESVLLGRVKGAVQGEVNMDGRLWRQVSYHPHAGGGNAPWDPNRFGIHTYLGDIISWLEVR